MANTYLNILLHLVFAVKNREAMISPLKQDLIYGYISGILKKRGNRVIKIGGTDDHVHIFFYYNGKDALCDVVKDIKTSTSKFINESRLCLSRFSWQRGYACLSYSSSQKDRVINYIAKQREHHKGVSLVDEIQSILRKSGVEYDEQYIFQEPE